MQGRTTSKAKVKKLTIGIVAAIVIACTAFVILERTGTTDIIHASLLDKQVKLATTTSKEPSAQSDFNSGSPRTTDTTSKQEGTLSDNKGVVSSTPPESQWTTSPNGAIVVYSPAANSTLRAGDSLTGSASSDRVSYRLTDNVSGVIATGSIAVVSGKFSGTFNFTSKGTLGQIDIFNQAYDGTESNNISIPVRLN